MAKPKFYVSDMVYGPASKVSKDKLEKLFQKDHFNEAGCKPCEYKQERPCDTCHDCPNFFGTFKFWSKAKIDGEKYIGVAKGRMDLVEKLFGELPADRTKDKRTSVPFKTKLKLELDLYDYQVTSVNKMAKYNQGVLRADPRVGKTIMAIALACRKKQRTLIIAHQDDLLKQFYETFTGLNLQGKPSKDFPKATNAVELQEKHGYNPVIIAKKPQDFFGKEDVVLTTYQKFISPSGKKLLKKVAKRFGLVVVDEVHRASADCYSQVLAALNPKYMYSLTATPALKSGMEFIREYIVGPIRCNTKAESLTPRLTVIPSALNKHVKARQWVYIVKGLYRNEARTKGIVDQAIKCVEAGEHVLIPATQRFFIDDLVEKINLQWMKKTGASTGIAEAFYRMPGKNTKEEILNRARSGKTKVIVALRSMLTGVNVPVWSAILEVSPINNETNLVQELKRICTPREGKQPKIYWFVDEKCDVAMRCFLASWRHMQNMKVKADDETVKSIGRLAAGMRNKVWNPNDSSDTSSRDKPSAPSFGTPGKRFSL